MKYFLSLLLCWTMVSVLAQNNIGIGTASPNPRALLDMNATDKGVLIPRLSDAQRLALNPQAIDNGLLVYGTDDNLFYYWNGLTWIPFPAQSMMPAYNISMNFDSQSGTLSLTDGGGTLTANIPSTPPAFNTAFNFNSSTGDLSIVDGGGTLSVNLPSAAPSYNTALNFNAQTGILAITDGGGTLTTNIPSAAPAYNTAFNFNSQNGDLTITDGGGALTVNIPTASPAYNTTLNFNQQTGLLSITDGGGTLTTTISSAPDDDWTRNTGAGVLHPFYLTDRVAIGANNAHPSAILDVQSTTQGFLTPRMTSAQRLAINSPATGLEVFDINAGVKMFFNGSRWLEVGAEPIGSIIAWHKTLTGTPALLWGWAECNGQVITDAESPYNGTNIPDLNNFFTTESGAVSGGGRFLRGGTTSGTMNSDQTNNVAEIGSNGNNGCDICSISIPQDGTWPNAANAPGYDRNGRNTSMRVRHRAVETRPGNMTVVWIMRIK